MITRRMAIDDTPKPLAAKANDIAGRLRAAVCDMMMR
jgi:hypothetical protein